MAESFLNRLQHGWNAFMGRSPTTIRYPEYGMSSYYRPDRMRLSRGADKSIVTMVYNRIAIDVASIHIEHVRVDGDGRFVEEIKSGLNNCLKLDANIDQTGRALMLDIVMSMFDDGCVAVVPTDTNINPNLSGSYDIEKLRVGKIVEWFPEHIRVNLYNEKVGQKQDVLLSKKAVAIIENPLYAIMNEPNSTLQRLIRTLARLDMSNENNSSGKLDLIIQLPYVIKSTARQNQAEERRKQIEAQLAGSKYGIAYTDATEKITQVNRGVENNLWQQVKDLTSMLYNQLGLTEEVLNGTADEKVMINYYNRTVEPIVACIADEMMRKFLTKTARTQGQAIYYYRDPFSLVPVNELAEIADKFTRNEIATSNEIRAEIGWKPSKDPRADELRNKNLNASSFEQEMLYGNQNGLEEDPEAEGYEDEAIDPDSASDEDLAGLEDDYNSANSDLDGLDLELDELEALLNEDDKKKKKDDELKHYASPYYDPVKAHEYYMEHRVLKGRRSTAGLNDEGKAAARYVKKKLDEERKSRQAGEKARYDSYKRSNSEGHKNMSLAERNALKQRVASRNAKLKADIASDREALKGRVTQRNTQTKASIDKKRETIKSEIERNKEKTQSKIEQLRERLKKMRRSVRLANKDSIANQIKELRDQNSATRLKIRETFNSDSKKSRETNKQQNTLDRTSVRDTATKSRLSNRETNTSDRTSVSAGIKSRGESVKAANKQLSDESKSVRDRIKADYDARYESELDRIRNSPGFQKVSKSKSSGTTTDDSGGGSWLRRYRKKRGYG